MNYFRESINKILLNIIKIGNVWLHKKLVNPCNGNAQIINCRIKRRFQLLSKNRKKRKEKENPDIPSLECPLVGFKNIRI